MDKKAPTLTYDTITGEIALNTNKTFIIHHPLYEKKYLVHACLEGPEIGVYYRGKGVFREGDVFSKVFLPNYVTAFATDFTVQVTPIMSEFHKVPNLGVSEVDDEEGSFRVFRNEVFHNVLKYNWVVHGKRGDIDVNPDKDNVIVNGQGPYRWI